jgi:lysophospholipase L1-like esterase
MFDEKTVQRKIEQDSKYFPYHFLLGEFRRFKELKTLILNRFALIRERKKFTEQLFRGTRETVIPSKYYNGFIPYERKGGLDKKRDLTPRNGKAQIDAFEDLLDEFEKSKVQVIFVQAPGYLPARDSSNIEESMKLINEIVEKRRILFLDYDTKRITNINTDPSMFSDWIHLNEKGSEAFSKLLKGDIESLLKQKAARN